MPRVHDINPPGQYADERIELLLEPGQVVDLVDHMKCFPFKKDNVPSTAVPLWRLDANASFAVVRLALSSADVVVEAAVQRAMFSRHVFCGPWMTGQGQRAEGEGDATILVVPARMGFRIFVRNPTRSNQHAVIYMRNRIREIL